jgi:hypothetical protein
VDNSDPPRCKRIILHKSAGPLWISKIYGVGLARQGTAEGVNSADVALEKSRENWRAWPGSNPRVAVTLIS